MIILPNLQEGIPSLSDDFQDFRFRAVEAVEETVFIVGFTTCFVQVRLVTEDFLKFPCEARQLNFTLTNASLKNPHRF